MTALRTEFEFTLPIGIPDADGTPQRHGVMRLATGNDEIAPLRDPRVRANSAFLAVILLSRVILRIGTIDRLNPSIVENMYSADLKYLEAFYDRINMQGSEVFTVTCPGCDKCFDVEPAALGEPLATP